MAKYSLEEMSQRFEEMEKRLRVVEDIEEIKRLHRHYANCFMTGKWEEVLDCFAESCKAVMGGGAVVYDGKKAIEKHFREEVSQAHIGKEGDVLVHPIISVDGDQAKGEWLFYMMYFHPKTYQSLFWIQGFYECEYMRENGKWKFSLFSWSPRLAPPGCPPNEDMLYHFLDQ